MNPIERLKAIRTEAWERLEAQRKAIDESSDGKLVATLESMIQEMEQAQTVVNQLPGTVDDLSLDDLIADLETPLEPDVEVTGDNYLEAIMSVDRYLSQLAAMTTD